MTVDDKMTALWSIINMCDAGHCLLGHVQDLRSMEDHPAVKGLSGILDAIKAQAHAVERVTAHGM